MKKNPSQTVFAFLKGNLGKRCLAPLTTTDAKALLASVMIVDLWTTGRDNAAIAAWHHVVGKMQETTRHLAFHAVAHVSNWEDRWRFWDNGWGEMPTEKCAFEPGGSAR